MMNVSFFHLCMQFITQTLTIPLPHLFSLRKIERFSRRNVQLLVFCLSSSRHFQTSKTNDLYWTKLCMTAVIAAAATPIHNQLMVIFNGIKCRKDTNRKCRNIIIVMSLVHVLRERERESEMEEKKPKRRKQQQPANQPNWNSNNDKTLQRVNKPLAYTCRCFIYCILATRAIHLILGTREGRYHSHPATSIEGLFEKFDFSGIF